MNKKLIHVTKLNPFWRNSHLEMVILTRLECDIVLEWTDKTNQTIQEKKMELGNAVSLLKALKENLTALHDQFPDFEKLAQEKAVCKEYRDATGHGVTRKCQFDKDTVVETVLSGSDKFHIDSFLPIIDSLCVTLDKRTDA